MVVPTAVANSQVSARSSRRTSCARPYWCSPSSPPSPGMAATTALPWIATAARGAYAVRTYVVTAVGDTTAPRIRTSLASRSLLIRSPPESQPERRSRCREPQRRVQRGRRAGDRRRHPRDNGGRGDGEGQEDQPDDERCAQGAAVILGGGGLAVRDHQPQRFRRPAADGCQVAGEPPQHLPHTEQPAPQPAP